MSQDSPDLPDLADKVVEVELDHGAYLMRSDWQSYEIFEEGREEDAALFLEDMRSSPMNSEVIICINDMWIDIARRDQERTKIAESEIGIERRIAEVSKDGRDYVELSSAPIFDAPEDVRSNHRKEVIQRPRYWQAKHIHEVPAFDDRAASRSVVVTSLTYQGPCTGDEINLSEEWQAMAAKKLADD